MSTAAATVHTILAPSGADRWSNCLGALAACKGLPERPAGDAAQLGSAKHALGEWCLKNPEAQTADAHVGQSWFLDATGSMVAIAPTIDAYQFEIDDTFADHVNTYIEYVRSRPGVKSFETWVSTADIFGVPGQGGTIDCLNLIAAERQIEIIDAKFGYVPVSAKHRQLRIYGAAALSLYDLSGDWDTVRCTIVQPQDVSEPVKSEVFTRAEIETFVADLAPRARKAWELYQNPPADLLKYLTPSDEACAWCPISGQCKARTDRIVGMFQDVTATTPDVVLLSDERIGQLYRETADIVEWAKSIAAEAESRALRGVHIPKHKLVWGRKGKRMWLDAHTGDVASILNMTLGEDDMYAPRKLVSPTQAEAALKKALAPALYAQIAPFVTQSDPQLRLVPEAAKGDAVTVAKVEFGVVT